MALPFRDLSLPFWQAQILGRGATAGGVGSSLGEYCRPLAPLLPSNEHLGIDPLSSLEKGWCSVSFGMLGFDGRFGVVFVLKFTLTLAPALLVDACMLWLVDFC